ncbi:MAG: hypothetical protein CMN30_11035 [Sandaracinus sp.]|nr:hypothetical protein [Sandaracinus sp.]
MKRVAQSPLAIVVLGLVAAFAWSAGYDVATGDGHAAADGPMDRATATQVTEGARAQQRRNEPPPPIVRQGPRILRDPAEGEMGYDISIEDRDGHSMDALHRALRRAERGEGQARLVFYGASHVASDLFTGYIRRELQRRFGDAGHGIILPAHPWPSYRHRDVDMESSRRNWDSEKVRGGTRDIDHFGVAGTYVESDRAGAWGRVSTDDGELGSKASLFDVYYLQQPEGGSFDVFVDGRRTERVSTAGEGTQGGYATYRVPDGEHQLEVRTVGDGMVRFFGVAVERETPGVIVDTLGINGARARYHLLWDDTLYREHLRRRQPDLVVIAYGTNESGDEVPIERYEQRVREVMTRIRETTPDASCLLVGPSDRPVRRDDGSYEDRPRTHQLIEAQHRVAVQTGCGFFDLVAFSGGPLSMVEWSAADPAFGAPDHVHYTRRGYERLGQSLLAALLEGYGGAGEAAASSSVVTDDEPDPTYEDGNGRPD